MKTRPGVSLVETLVAAVLLMIGVAGSLHALAASARLRHEAAVRERTSSLVHDRLLWFEAGACAGGDTSETQALPGQGRLHWQVTGDSLQRVLRVELRRAGHAVPRMQLVTRRPCG